MNVGLKGTEFVAALSVVALLTGSAGAQTLSGTIRYDGSRFSVSPAQPILLLLFEDIEEGEPVASAIVVENDTAFSLDAPFAGTFHLAYGLTFSDASLPAVGRPFEIFNDRFDPPGDPLNVPQSGLALEFDDSGLLSGFAGTVTYTGSLGPVSPQHPLIVAIFEDAELEELDDLVSVTSNGGRYDYALIDSEGYYLAAFLDVNGNGDFDSGEPFEIYRNKSDTPADRVFPGPAQTDLDFTFGDENIGPMPSPTFTGLPTSAPTRPTPTFTSARPSATPTRTRTTGPTPTPGPCFGDCDGDGMVRVNELITGVAIALERRPIADCRVFDINEDQRVGVSELVQAVNASLRGCRRATALVDSPD